MVFYRYTGCFRYLKLGYKYNRVYNPVALISRLVPSLPRAGADSTGISFEAIRGVGTTAPASKREREKI